MRGRAVLLGSFSWIIFAATAYAQVEAELFARSRVFPEVGPGTAALKRDPAGRYYVLIPRSRGGSTVLIYDKQGKPLGQIPPAGSSSAAGGLVYGEDFDVDPTGRLYVADRAANAVKVFAPDGSLAQTIPIVAPTSVAALLDGEFVVASAGHGSRRDNSPKLVTVFDNRGRVSREFGDLSQVAERRELNRFLNIGRVATDPVGHIYYAFSYLPEPTLRKYDRFGYAVLEIELATLEFQPAAQATRREIARQESRSIGSGTPSFKPIVNAIAVDPETQEIWLARGALLLHFTSEGVRRATYRTFTPEGARIEASAILIEPDRLVLASDTLGIFEFPRPDHSGGARPDKARPH